MHIFNFVLKGYDKGGVWILYMTVSHFFRPKNSIRTVFISIYERKESRQRDVLLFMT